jgi:glyoxylase-like metal-dependent hydrolase (beta-lactamase superfamily II)
MRRASLLLVLLVGGAVSILVAEQRGTPPPTPPMSLEKLEDNLFILHGGCMCGNTTFYITDAGVVMVDTKVAGQGEAILEQLRTVTDKPIAMIINTHTHFDHTGSNAEFGAVERIVAHENAKASLMKPSCAPVTNCDAFKGDDAQYLPNVTFKDKRTLTLGSDQVDLYYFGPGHTDGDSWIVFPALRVALGGDLFGAKGVPYIDTENGGTAIGFGDTIARAAAGLKDVDTVISGHVDAYPFSDLVRYAEFHKHLKEYVLAGQKAGKSAEDVAGAYTVPADLQDFSFMAFFANSFVQLMYEESSAE